MHIFVKVRLKGYIIQVLSILYFLDRAFEQIIFFKIIFCEELLVFFLFEN